MEKKMEKEIKYKISNMEYEILKAIITCPSQAIPELFLFVEGILEDLEAYPSLVAKKKEMEELDYEELDYDDPSICIYYMKEMILETLIAYPKEALPELFLYVKSILEALRSYPSLVSQKQELTKFQALELDEKIYEIRKNLRKNH